MLAQYLPVVIPTALCFTGIVGIAYVISKGFHCPDLLAGPFSRVLGEVLDIVDGIVPFVLSTVFEVIPAVFDSIRNFLCFANLCRVKT